MSSLFSIWAYRIGYSSFPLTSLDIVIFRARQREVHISSGWSLLTYSAWKGFTHSAGPEEDNCPEGTCLWKNMVTHQYSRDDASSKSKPIAQTYSWKEVVGAFFFGLLPLVILSYFQWQMLLVLIPVFLTRFFLARYFQKWIDGYTGDCLGATQQVCEVVFYISVIALWKFI